MLRIIVARAQRSIMNHVAEICDHLAIIDMGRKVRGGDMPLFVGVAVSPFDTVLHGLL